MSDYVKLTDAELAQVREYHNHTKPGRPFHHTGWFRLLRPTTVAASIALAHGRRLKVLVKESEPPK